jgi:hypothetical protein
MAQKFGKDFGTPGRVKKEYVARVSGCFPTNRTDPSIPDDDHVPGEDLICEEPLLTIDKQIGVNVVHPDGRVNWLLRYDSACTERPPTA